MKRTLLLNPQNQTATWDQIKLKRDEIEQSPITLAEGSFDADELSLKRMELALANFNDLPTLVNGKLTWKLADNSTVDLTVGQLQTVYNELKKQLAIRAANLHYNAVILLQSGKTCAELGDLSVWGLSDPGAPV